MKEDKSMLEKSDKALIHIAGTASLPKNNRITESVKNDRKDDKLMWELLPLQDMEEIVKVYTAGAKKYGPNRWQNLPDGYNRYKAAMFRHLLEHEKGNEIDEETGCLHIAQVAWNAIALLHVVKKEMKDKQMSEIIEQFKS